MEVNGPILQAILDNIVRYRTISGDIGQNWAISSDIRVIFSSVKSVMCWVRSKSSSTGSVNYKPNMVRPCRIRTVTISLKITDIGQYRCIAIYVAQFCSLSHSIFNLNYKNFFSSIFLDLKVSNVYIVSIFFNSPCKLCTLAQ